MHLYVPTFLINRCLPNLQIFMFITIDGKILILNFDNTFWKATFDNLIYYLLLFNINYLNEFML